MTEIELWLYLEKEFMDWWSPDENRMPCFRTDAEINNWFKLKFLELEAEYNGKKKALIELASRNNIAV